MRLSNGFHSHPDGVRIVINWHLGTQTYSYVLYATMPGFVTVDMAALAAAVAAVHNATVKGYFSQNVTYDNVTVYDARTVDGEIVVSTVNTGAGTQAQEAMPINTAVCVTLRTGSRGRSARGRKYITGWGKTPVRMERGARPLSPTRTRMLGISSAPLAALDSRR